MPLRAFIIVLMLINTARSQSHSAAEAYQGAFKEIPKPFPSNALEIPLDDDARGYLKQCEKSLAIFDAASSIAFNDWGFDESDSLSGTRPVLGIAQLSDVVTLRARVRFADGQYSAALDDCYNLAILARRLSVQPSLVRQEQQNAVMQRSFDIVGMMMLKAPKDQIARFVSRLDELRSPVDPVDVALNEKKAYFWLQNKLIEDPSLRRMVSRTRGAFGELLDPKLPQLEVQDLLEDPDNCAAVFDQADAAFDDMIRALRSSPQERDAAMLILPIKYARMHPLVRSAARIVVRTHQLDRDQSALVEMLKTAVDIAFAYPMDDQVARQKAGTFTYQTTEGGFELRSTSVVLHVGPRPVQKVPTSQPTTQEQGESSNAR